MSSEEAGLNEDLRAQAGDVDSISRILNDNLKGGKVLKNIKHVSCYIKIHVCVIER